MMKKYICFILLLLLLLFTLTGCYDSTGIEDFYYIVAIGIDKAENGMLRLSVQNAKPNGSSDSSTSQSNEYKIYTVDCESLESGISILNNYLNKKINLSHCSAIVFSEELAKENIKGCINVLGNDTEIRPNCSLIISSKTAYDVLDKVSNSGEKFSSRLYEYILNSVDYTGYTIDCTFNTFFTKLNSSQMEATAIYALVNEDTVQNAGAAIFKDSIMVGTITPSQTIAHLIINNELDSCLISIDNPFNRGDIIDLNLRKTTLPKIDIDLINRTPYIHVNLSIEASIDGSGEDFDYTSVKNIKLVEKAANEYLEALLKEYLYTISKDYNSDIIGFGGRLATKYLTEDDFQKIHWREIFQDSFFEVTVDTRISSSHLFNKE